MRDDNLQLNEDFTFAEGGVGEESTPVPFTTPAGATAFGTTLFTSADAAAGRSALGLGTIATQDAASVTVTNINATGEYRVDGTKVVGNRGAAVADAAGGATVDAEARAAINALLAELRTHGLIAP